jgi:hypothetical protein
VERLCVFRARNSCSRAVFPFCLGGLEPFEALPGRPAGRYPEFETLPF